MEVSGPRRSGRSTRCCRRTTRGAGARRWTSSTGRVPASSTSKRSAQGTLTPVFFGSALRNFGVRDLLDALVAHAPPPRAQTAATRTVEATEPAMSGHRVQDPGEHGPEPPRSHRLHAGVLGQAHARHARQGRAHGQDDGAARRRSSSSRRIARSPRRPMPATWSAFRTSGTLRIGDALTEGEDLKFVGIPSFAPEILRRVRLGGRDHARRSCARRCRRWRRKASCSCSRRSTARRRSSA